MPLYGGARIWLSYLKKIALKPRWPFTFSEHPLPIQYDPWGHNRTHLFILAHLISTNDKLEHWWYFFLSLEVKADQVHWWYFTHSGAGISSGALLSHSLFSILSLRRKSLKLLNFLKQISCQLILTQLMRVTVLSELSGIYIPLIKSVIQMCK